MTDPQHDPLHDALTAEARRRRIIEHDTNDIETKLEQIRWWYPQIAENMLTISGNRMDLTGIPSTGEAAMPGGDALAMLGPWSGDADHGDDLPHPAQIIREWADHWRAATRTPTPPGARWGAHLAVLQANTEWFIRQDNTGEFRANICAIHGRLQALVGEAPEKPTPEPDDITQMGDLIPDGTTLTRDEAGHFWPDQLNTAAWAALRKRAQRARADGHHIPPRRYPVEWIRDVLTKETCT